MAMRGFLGSICVVAAVLCGCSSTERTDESETTVAASETSSSTSAVLNSDSTATSLTSTPSVESSTVTAPPVGADTTVAPSSPDRARSLAKFDPRRFIEQFASDELAGRDNDTAGSAKARRLLIEDLSTFTEPAYPNATGDRRFLQSVDHGTNVLAVLPGSDLANEYVVLGAHYDHLGSDCTIIDERPVDTICNGATDNAAGVAAALAVAHSLAATGPHRRSIIVAFWDREEDNFGGSLGYLADPPAPVAATRAYVNFDIQGADLSDTLANVTFMVGAETGGSRLIEAARQAATSSTLATEALSLIFGQGRSDHAVFVNAGVASVFFTDANNGCYHTTNDEADRVNYAKLDEQIKTAFALMQHLSTTDAPPTFVPHPATSSFTDAEAVREVLATFEPSFAELSTADQSRFRESLNALSKIVAAGPSRYDDAAIGTVIASAAGAVSTFARLGC